MRFGTEKEFGRRLLSADDVRQLDVFIGGLEAKLKRAEDGKWVVWEGDESEGRWRCLMCGDTREGVDDTGPEGVQHRHDCGEGGTTIWAFDRMQALATPDPPG